MRLDDVAADFRLALAPELRPVSLVLAALPEGRVASVTEVTDLLEAGPWRVREQEVLAEHRFSQSQWELRLLLEPDEDRAGIGDDDGEEPLEMIVFLAPAEEVHETHLERSPLTDEQVRALERSRFSLGVGCVFGGRPHESFHRQMRLLDALAPDAVVVIDAAAAQIRSGGWLRDLAQVRTPPSTTHLFSIHTVAEEGDDRCWMHTHGLARCGALELELLDVPREHVGAFGHLLNAVAGLFLEDGAPEPGEPFVPGQDIELCWIPWPIGVKALRPRSGGGLDDRDSAHGGPSAVLAVPGQRRFGLFGARWRSPALYAPLLEGEPILFVSTAETGRRASLASERLPRLRQLFARYGSNEEWMFLLKLAFDRDEATHAADREHLWFEAHAFVEEDGEARVDATCLNAPWAVAELAAGQRAVHRLDRLSDWAVLCRLGRFEPDSVQHLEALLAGSDPRPGPPPDGAGPASAGG